MKERGSVAFFRVAMSRHIAVRALKVALVVGSILNLVNQGEHVVRGGAIDWFHLIMNFLVPYCVSTYSAAKNEIEAPE